MRYLHQLLLMMVLIFLSAVSCQAIADNATKLNEEYPKDAYLFIQTAKSGFIQYNKSMDSYQLVLKNVDSWVAYFSNSPAKISGFMSLSDFIKMVINESLKYKSGLNTGLIAFQDHHHKMVRYIFSIKKPIYNYKNNVITYTIKFLPNESHPVLEKLSFEHVALFIDEGCASCGGGGF